MDTLLNVALGLGLAAACGFRVFVPFLVMSLAVRGGYLELSSGFAWVGSDAALVAFAIATGLEIAGYFIPWVDNMLDMIASPAAIVAGVVVTAAVITDMDPLWKWTLAVIAGGGLASTTQAVTVAGRGVSSMTTLGFANPAVAAGEAVGSFSLSALAVARPLLALAVGLSIGFLLARQLLFRPPRPAHGVAA